MTGTEAELLELIKEIEKAAKKILVDQETSLDFWRKESDFWQKQKEKDEKNAN